VKEKPLYKRIKLVLSDVDGVWTDGGLYFTEDQEIMKRFSVYDGWGVRYCRYLGIPVGIITAEDVAMARRIAEKFKTPYIFTGIKEKMSTAQALCDKLGVSLEETAYIGDDLNDIPLLQAVGFSGTPSSAPKWVRDRVDYVCETPGGLGAFREFVEVILEDSPEFAEVIETLIRDGVYKPK
jgi:3-deoxy-D-manno-octulosonate 8-phosphate phosphatase (KDO 8-P phosphatase)